MRARALYEVTKLLVQYAPAATRGSFEQLRDKAETFYLTALENGRVVSALEKTHPTHYRALRRQATEAVNLLVRNRTMSGGRTVTATLDGLLGSSPGSTYVYDLVHGYVLPNWAALAERVGKTQVCPDLAGEIGESFERVMGGSTPGQQFVPDWLLWFGEHSAAAISNGLSSGPIGNSAVAYLLESYLPRIRMDQQGVRRSLIEWASYFMPAAEREAMHRSLEQGHYDQAKALFREHHFSGAGLSGLFMVVDWINVVTRVQAMIGDERQRTTGNYVGFLIDTTTAATDTFVFLGRARIAVRQLTNRFLAAERLEAAVVARRAGDVFYAEALLGREIGFVAGRALTLGAGVNVVFSAVMIAVDFGDAMNDLANGDTVGAGFAGLRCLGSALILASVFCPGPWSFVTAGAGIALQVFASFEEDLRETTEEPPERARAMMLDLITSLRRFCPTSSEITRTETPRAQPETDDDPRYRQMDAGVAAPPPIVTETRRQILNMIGGLRSPLQDVENALPASNEHYHDLVARDDDEAVGLRRRLRALGLASDYGIVRSQRSHADRSRMRALE
jgi:hypothetical protein